MRQKMMILAALCVALMMTACVESPSGTSTPRSVDMDVQADMTITPDFASEDMGQPEEDMAPEDTDMASADMSADMEAPTEDMSPDMSEEDMTPQEDMEVMPVPECGDGVVEGTEQCDEGQRNGELCDPAYGASCMFCGLDCREEIVRGGSCGDGVLNGAEQCEAGLGCTQCACDEGYVPMGGACADRNECLDNPCGANATCTNTQGGFMCECKSGFSGDGFTCQDIPECQGDPCGEGEACQEAQGGGYVCVDINECNIPGSCPVGSLCFNKDATDSQNITHQCFDRDECFFDEDNCGAGTTCVNRDATQGEGRFVCEDVDECQNNPCGANATCTNEVGGYRCDCDAGYTGDGVTCRELNVCGDGILEGTEQCDAGAQTGQSCTAPYNGTCSWCASDCSGVITEQGGTCGDGVVQGNEQCDLGNANVAQAPQCEPWEDCPAACTTTCQQVAARPATCLQYQGDVTLMTARNEQDWNSPIGTPRWAVGDWDCDQPYGGIMDPTQYCSISGSLFIRTGASNEGTVVDYNGATRQCKRTAYDLAEIHPTALPLVHIGGDLVIEGPGRSNVDTTIYSLHGLENLTRVEGRVRTHESTSAKARPTIEDASALSALTETGGVDFSFMSLTFCDSTGVDCAFDALTKANGSLRLQGVKLPVLHFDYFPLLTEVTGTVLMHTQHVGGGMLLPGEMRGFDQLHTVGGDFAIDYSSFDALPGAPNLSSLGGAFTFTGNPFLTTPEKQAFCNRVPSAACVP